MGTDLYDEKLNKVKTIPYKNNYGYFLLADQILGTEWKKKRLKKKEDVYKLTTLHLKLIGKFNLKVPVWLLLLFFYFSENG